MDTRFCERYWPPVGASLLAKNVRPPRSSRQFALSLTSIASRLAPTGKHHLPAAESTRVICPRS
ncbi:hypothetical protein C1X61_18080 [Pseudomonas sp. FW215-T2]|nr:hypothetical protein C1X61_18080 [Pseudomonas sp. FW215-T2]PNA10080.1 hypothetical protein C1X62_19330 [Pseudomonas sp. FW215-R3]PNB35757.1 hypothetical protein C1X63_21005 [Pseudomonas sp. FW305-131]